MIVRAYAADIVYKDAKERMVYAIATGPKMDLDGQGVDPEWLRSAVPEWMKRGNIRLMHNPTIPPVGKAKQAVELPNEDWAVAIKVTDDDTWKMINDDQVLTGISIGVKNATVVADSRFPKGKIAGGEMIEMSFVDYPAYKSSVLTQDPESLGVTFFKRAGTSIHYNGVVIEEELPAAVQHLVDLNKVAGAVELPGVVRDRLERQRQEKETAQAQNILGAPQNPYIGRPIMVVPGKTTVADLAKITQLDVPVTETWTKAAAADIEKRFGDYDAEYIFKRSFSDKKRSALAKEGKAESDGSYPIENEEDLKNAVSAYGRSKNKSRTKAHIISRAKALGKTDLLPADWTGSTKKEKAVKPEVTKVVASRTQGLIAKCGDACYPMEEYLFTPMTNEDGEVELQGDEAVHQKIVNQIIQGFRQLAIQEMQEDEIEFGCLEDLSDVAKEFLNWVWHEQMEGEADALHEQMESASLAMIAEPDASKRHAMGHVIAESVRKFSTLKEASVTTDAEKAAKGGAGDAKATDPKDAKDDGPKGGENADGADEGDEGEGGDDGKRTAKKTGQKPVEKAVEPDAAKIGKAISRATADQLLELANTPGVPAGVRASLESLAGFEATRQSADGSGDDMFAEVKDPRDAVTGNLSREKIDGASNAFGTIMAEVSASFVTPTGKAATPDTTKATAADLFKSNVSKIAGDAAVEALEKFVTSDAFVSAISAGVRAQVDAAKATDVAKVAADAVADVKKAADEKIEEVRKGLEAEITRIKQLPQPPKGVVTEGTQAIDKSFQVNGSETVKVATPTAEENLGALIMKRAMAGDPAAQRVLREAVENAQPGAGQDAAATAAYRATVTGQPSK